MATLAEIISDVAIMTPYSTAIYTDAVLIRWMNDYPPPKRWGLVSSAN